MSIFDIKKIKGAELFIKCLEEEGVEFVFGLPGEENLDFLECLCKSNKIKLILTLSKEDLPSSMKSFNFLFFTGDFT